MKAFGVFLLLQLLTKVSHAEIILRIFDAEDGVELDIGSLANGRMYKAMCEMTEKSELLPAETRICDDSGYFNQSLDRTNTSVSAFFSPSMLGPWSVTKHLSCCGPVESEFRTFDICNSLQKSSLSAVVSLASSAAVLTVAAEPNITTVRGNINCTFASDVTRNIRFKFSSSPDVFNCPSDLTCEAAVDAAHLGDLSAPISIAVLDATVNTHIYRTSVIDRQESAMVAVLGDIVKLKRPDTVHCFQAGEQRDMNFVFHGDETGLVRPRDLGNVYVLVTCTCNLTRYGTTTKTGRYESKWRDTRRNGSRLQTSVKLPDGALCDCESSWRFGSKAPASDPKLVTCWSREGPSPAPALLLGRTNSTAAIVHVVAARPEELHGDPVSTKLELLDLYTGTQVGDPMEIPPGATYVELQLGDRPRILLGETLSLEIRGGSNRSAEFVPSRLVRPADRKLKCTPAVIAEESGNNEKLHFQVQCEHQLQSRPTLLLKALACVREHSNSPVCKSPIYHASTEVRNATLDDLQDAIVSISLPHSSESELTRMINIGQLDPVLIGVSVTVIDSTTGEPEDTTGLLESACVYRGNREAQQPSVRARKEVPLSVVVDMPSCSRFPQRGLINQMRLRYCRRAEPDECHMLTRAVPYRATATEYSFETQLDEAKQRGLHVITMDFLWCHNSSCVNATNVQTLPVSNEIEWARIGIIIGGLFAALCFVVFVGVVLYKKYENRRFKSLEETAKSADPNPSSKSANSHLYMTNSKQYSGMQTQPLNVTDGSTSDDENPNSRSKLV